MRIFCHADLERSCGTMCQRICSNAVGGLIILQTCASLIQDTRGHSLLSTFLHFLCTLYLHVVYMYSVKQVSADAVKRDLENKRVSVLESFDVKFTNPRSRKRMAIDVRIKFEQDQPIIFHAKRNEAKIVVFNVLSLHRYIVTQECHVYSVYEKFLLHAFRSHDIRMTLNYCEVMNKESPEYEVIERLVKTVSLSDPEKRTITLETRTDDWSVNFIRHKMREAYRIDDKYMVTVNTIRECQFNEEPFNTLVPITPDRYKTHTEMEVK